jgi:DNA-binding NtrC family response regulator
MSTPTLTPSRLLIVDDDTQLAEALSRRFLKLGLRVTAVTSGEQALTEAGKARFDVALLDLHLPGWMAWSCSRSSGGAAGPGGDPADRPRRIETAILAMKPRPTTISKPFHLPDLEIHVEKAAERFGSLAANCSGSNKSAMNRPATGSSAPPGDAARRSSDREGGPDSRHRGWSARSGTGKGWWPGHCLNSPRADRPLVAINCARAETLLESELFGHGRRLHRADRAKPGLFEVAEGGTLFIDEVAEMAPGLQAKFLRVLEEGHFRRVGGTRELTADVRVIAATNRVLEQEQKAGRFREDLYYRLNVVNISLPLLRERREDIPDLVNHFLTNRPVGPVRRQIHPDALAALVRYDWPGNVRELANVIERAQILAEGDVITR